MSDWYNWWIDGRKYKIWRSWQTYLNILDLSENFSQEQLQTAYKKKMKTARSEMEVERIKGDYERLLKRKKCEECQGWAIFFEEEGDQAALILCSVECLRSCKAKCEIKSLAIQEIKNQLQQKGINGVGDLGEVLVEIQALFPWNCQCDHPWTYEYHIKNCLTDAGQIENFKNNYLNIIAKISPGPQSTTNPQTSQPDNPNNSQNNEQNQQNREKNTSSDTSNQTAGSSSSDNSSSSASSENSGSSYASSSDGSTASSPNSSNSNDNSTNFKPKEKPTTNQPTSSPEPTKVSTDEWSSEKNNEIEKKINEAINKPTKQFSEEEIKNTLQELEQFNKDLEQNKQELSQPEKEQLQEKADNLKIDLQIEAIKRIDNQLAKEIVREYIQQQKITDFKEKELVKELETLTTTRAIAHKVQQIINQLKQQKLQNTSFQPNLSHQQIKTNYLPWVLGGIGIIAVMAGLVWYFKKGENK